MLYLFIKTLLTGITVVAISEIAKRSSLFAAMIASLPLTSILAFIWIYIDTKDIEQIKSLSTGIFWMVLPSLFIFIALPLLLKFGMRFYPALIVSCLSMSGVYWGYSQVLKRFGVLI